ncbi:D-cysteine desulfhydrase family protein [Paramaledivibacter caminithermalis]|jgi:D-cysteine desulfhydrase|uniref:D-cysteine desulfhydrase n=1 Tax=Paramaledivibacter caminithermalis (strain DSM 15212 / CIP 107654 / DViRD3) TaxID=1121301 RepID=A0A1M6KL07_PARC5|nr:D-cysteine desulfhydrase family protein [Paramaledivibacter caminithermalis]SHJ59521.1 D-cysteine desulfhydrase [Paramaledivibacter caminithermalis DSM 15212]
MVNIPSKIKIANLPTKIEKLERLSKKLGGPSIFIKRDDQTGIEFSGNKVRKLEFAVKEAMDQGCNLLITCGGIQSNHARATAAVAAKVGMASCLVLRTNKEEEIDGNYFLDKILGAKIKFITPKEYKESRMEIMEELKQELSKEGYKPYIIPEGASNGIGTFGYFNAMEEIIEQEKEMGIKFDAVVIAVGSGGTYGGLFLGNKVMNNGAKIYGVNACENEEYFKNQIDKVIKESLDYIDEVVEFTKDEINILDGYVGRGYALSRPEEIEFIHEIAKLEGIILDPVYTGKAMYGLANEIKKGSFKNHNNILFIHTGGLYGLFSKKDLFSF